MIRGNVSVNVNTNANVNANLNITVNDVGINNYVKLLTSWLTEKL